MENEEPRRSQREVTEVTTDSNSPNAASESEEPIPSPEVGHEAQQQTPYQHGSISDAFAPMNMSGMANALPDYAFRGYQHVSYPQQAQPNAMNPTMMYHFQNPQYAAANSSNFSPTFNPQTGMPTYGSRGPYSNFPSSPSSPGASQTVPGQMYLPPGMVANSIHSQYQQFQGYSQGTAFVPITNSAYQRHGSQYMHAPTYSSPGLQAHQPLDAQGTQRSSSVSSPSTPTTLRGPPRKPKQSGHALWVGNLPPGTNIVDLKDHFSRDATTDIESVFLISKSNCAFVNYKSEASCSAAMSRFHDSRFQGVRLVCRLRRGSAPGSLPLSPPPQQQQQQGETTSEQSVNAEAARLESGATETRDEAPTAMPEQQSEGKVKEKFFIIKSLTIEDMERSVQSGVWATQSHNEAALNRAFRSAEDVYLIFSANKSGEYFGYARMDSAIGDEISVPHDVPPVQEPSAHETSSPSATDLPLTIPTSATATAPPGHIIDDSARGTIFWEAESVVTDVLAPGPDADPEATDITSVSDNEETPHSPTESPSIASHLPPQSTTFGKPFKITWQSTDRLPFYRTRGLRNPWNTNREVKIARDGTELEPNIGRKLISMFGTFPSGTSRPQQQMPYHMVVGQGQVTMAPMPGPGQVPGPGYPRPY